MKKIFFPLLITFLLFFNACKDDSGQFSEQIHTDSDASLAIKDCLIISLDTALSHLAVINGFYTYDDARYKIGFSQKVTDIMDSIVGFDERESIIATVNRIAENRGTNIRNSFLVNINLLTVKYPSDLILSVLKTAIVDYFTSSSRYSIENALTENIHIALTDSGFYNTWSYISQQYQLIHGNDYPFFNNLNIAQEVTHQIVDAILKEMAKEEKLIRTEESHRVTDRLKNFF